MEKKKVDIALIGLAVMGENLALNLESRGYTVAVYNRETETEVNVAKRFADGRGKNKKIVSTSSLKELVDTLNKPRKIMMMVKAGEAVDQLLEQLMPYLSPGDILIDGGNSDFLDTQRRVAEVEKRGFNFIGMGISGGEEGALHGPSLMPGGSESAWPHIQTIFESIAARLDDGTPCCHWMGIGGAGHFVKMVHNGIEYGDMQLIAESYAFMKNYIQIDNAEASAIFRDWNKSELESYLVEITADILDYREKDGTYLIDHILDAARQKGTGKWSVIAAIDEDDPLTLITQAVYARMLSTFVDLRQKAADSFPARTRAITHTDKAGKIVALQNALYAAKIISYTQGFSLLRRASVRYGWHLDYGAIANIWRKGCIIRSVFLTQITDAYRRNPELENLLFDRFFLDKIDTTLPGWRVIVAEGVMSGISLPCITSAIAYYDGLRSVHSSANLVQAQRDYFGAHTYERNDRERGVFFHTNWTGKGGDTVSGSYNV